MIFPTLRGYEADIAGGGCILIICRDCGHPRVIYRKLRGTQTVFPVYCVTCESVIEIEVRVKT